MMWLAGHNDHRGNQGLLGCRMKNKAIQSSRLVLYNLELPDGHVCMRLYWGLKQQVR